MTKKYRSPIWLPKSWVGSARDHSGLWWSGNDEAEPRPWILPPLAPRGAIKVMEVPGGLVVGSRIDSVTMRVQVIPTGMHNLGSHRSDETRRLMSEKMRESWQRRKAAQAVGCSNLAKPIRTGPNLTSDIIKPRPT